MANGKVRGILIDTVGFTITEVEVDALDTQEINLLLNSRFFEAPLIRENGDTLYVDEEGRLHDDADARGAFGLHDWTAEPFLSGKGLFLGGNDEGETIDVKATVDEIIATTELAIVHPSGTFFTLFPAAIAIESGGSYDRAVELMHKASTNE